MLTKKESNEFQKKPLRYYQELLTEYAKEYRVLGYQLYNNASEHSAINALLQLMGYMNDMLAELNCFTDSSLKTYLITKNWVLFARIKNSLLLLHRCLIIRLPSENETPTFSSVQEKVGWCLDALIFHNESMYYVSHFTNSLQVITIPKDKEEAFSLHFNHNVNYSITLAKPEQFNFIRSLPDLQISDKPGKMDYIALIKKVELSLYEMQFKDDHLFQMEMFYALTEAANQLEGNNKETDLRNRFPIIMTFFIKKCSDNIVKLTYYYRLIATEIENASNQMAYKEISEESKVFFDIYGKIAYEYNRLQKDNRLDPLQKVGYINANFFAHHIKLFTHPCLKGFNIATALQQFSGQKNSYDAITKYINIIIALRDEYFVKNAELLLGSEVICEASIAGYIVSTRSVCETLIDQISLMMQWSRKIQYTYHLEYKETLYNEIVKHKQIISQYYACYNVLNNHLTQGQHALRIPTELDKNYEIGLAMFSEFSTENSWNSMIGIIAYANREAQANSHQKTLLASEEKKIRKPKPVKAKELVLTNNHPIKEVKISNDKPLELEQVNPDILNVIEEGRICIKKLNYRGAYSSFWKAYNLAVFWGDNKQKLAALDCLCHVGGDELAMQLKTLAKATDKTLFNEGAKTLLDKLPLLRKLCNQYQEFAQTLWHTLSPSEKEGVDYSREEFWKKLLTVQNTLPLMMEQHAKKNKMVSRQKTKSNNNTSKQPSICLEKNDTVQSTLEKHFDDLATEAEICNPIIEVAKQSCVQKYTIVLPDNIQRIFTFLNQFKGTHYLVGSMVLQLMLKEYNQPSIAVHDADFISTCNDRASLIIAGFQENTYMRNLYSLYRHFEWPIDLISLSDEENWLMLSLNSRDFRVAALCCDKDGQITDPTGFGVEDLVARRLVMIGDPAIRFKHDPVLLLRTLKYMTFGFKPDALICDALSAWQPDVNTNLSKLYAVARKHLLKPDDREPFMDLLCQYELLGKMFNLKNEERAQLLPLLGVRTDVQMTSSYQYGLFKPHTQSGHEVVGFINRL